MRGLKWIEFEVVGTENNLKSGTFFRFDPRKINGVD
jgi:hypothetical protein